MKTNFLTFFLLFVSFSFFAQDKNDKIVYLDSIQRETPKGNHKYYRIIKDYKLDLNSYQIYDYYKSGVLQMEGTSVTKDNLSKEGLFTYYFENGNKKESEFYVKGRLNGETFQWYENGAKRLEGEYIEKEKLIGSELKINQFWNKEGIQTVIDGNGDYQDISEKLSESGKIKNGFKDGLWTGEYGERKIKSKYTEIYEGTKLISGTSTDFANNEYLYNVVSCKPEPKKGIEDFYRYVGANFRVPDYQINGKIITQFVVEKNGNIVELKTIKSINRKVDEEAIRVIKNYNNWIPAKFRGQNVRVLYSLPISIESSR